MIVVRLGTIDNE